MQIFPKARSRGIRRSIVRRIIRLSGGSAALPYICTGKEAKKPTRNALLYIRGRKKKDGKTGKGESSGGEQMEVGESRNKRYVNPRNGAVYSSHKKANKTFFRSGRYAHPRRSFSFAASPPPARLTPFSSRKNDRE